MFVWMSRINTEGSGRGCDLLQGIIPADNSLFSEGFWNWLIHYATNITVDNFCGMRTFRELVLLPFSGNTKHTGHSIRSLNQVQWTVEDFQMLPITFVQSIGASKMNFVFKCMNSTSLHDLHSEGRGLIHIITDIIIKLFLISPYAFRCLELSPF
jgi:hypothetical protein